MELKSLSLNSASIKVASEGREFSGYASVFGGVDSYGDTIEPGAYKATLVDRARPIQMRWNHFGPVIGKWVEIKEDDIGLFVRGELSPGHSVADDAYALLKHGAVNGLSIGYRIPEGGAETKEDVRILRAIDLVEVSIVETPADIAAQIGDVKSAIGELETTRDLENFLRDAGGFSRADAKALISRIKSMPLTDSGAKKADAAMAEAAKQIQHINHSILKGD
jgi:HK97 family phage prohead protease